MYFLVQSVPILLLFDVTMKADASQNRRLVPTVPLYHDMIPSQRGDDHPRSAATV